MALSEGDIAKHVYYFTACLRLLPHQYDSLDTNRMTAAYFAIMGLDVLGKLDAAYSVVPREDIIEWIYNLQVVTDSTDGERLASFGGFQGGTFVGMPFRTSKADYTVHKYGPGHIANTYTALAVLLALGDDLSRVDTKAVLNGLRALQNDDGSFNCVCVGSESDVRFAYCACAISYMLDDWSGFDVEKTAAWIHRCQSYESSFGMVPGQEGHGGTTYCALAALKLMGRFDSAKHKEVLTHWCLRRQVAGFQGRVNKKEDTCYSFWVGASLQMLGHNDLIEPEPLADFIGSCKTPYGGYSKVPASLPDILHSFYSVCGLSLIGVAALQRLDPKLGLTARASKLCEAVRAARRSGATAGATTSDKPASSGGSTDAAGSGGASAAAASGGATDAAGSGGASAAAGSGGASAAAASGGASTAAASGGASAAVGAMDLRDGQQHT